MSSFDNPIYTDIVATDWNAKLTPQAVSTDIVYMFGGPKPTDFQTVALGQKSRTVALSPTSEGHGVRGFVATILWPPGTMTGAVEIWGADQDEENAFALLGTVTHPAVQYSSPSGLVVTFMKSVIKTDPAPTHKLASRLMIR